MASRPRDKVWPWIAVAIVSLMIALAMMAWLPRSARAETRAQQHWGGADLPVSCQTVRDWSGPARVMSRAQRRALEREFNVTPKWKRQAYACLKGK